MLILSLVTLTFAALLAGTEFAVAAFIHPTLTCLPDRTHLAAAIPLAKLFGRVMPVGYALVLLLIASMAVLDHHRTGHWSPRLATSAALWALTILLSLAALVPINNRVVSWTPDTAPTHWKDDRTRWDRLHSVRVAFLITAFVLLAAGLLRPVV